MQNTAGPWVNELIEMNTGKQIVMRIAFDYKDLLVIKSKNLQIFKIVFIYLSKGKHFQQDKQKTNVSALRSS